MPLEEDHDDPEIPHTRRYSTQISSDYPFTFGVQNSPKIKYSPNTMWIENNNIFENQKLLPHRIFGNPYSEITPNLFKYDISDKIDSRFIFNPNFENYKFPMTEILTHSSNNYPLIRKFPPFQSRMLNNDLPIIRVSQYNRKENSPIKKIKITSPTSRISNNLFETRMLNNANAEVKDSPIIRIKQYNPNENSKMKRISIIS